MDNEPSDYIDSLRSFMKVFVDKYCEISLSSHYPDNKEVLSYDNIMLSKKEDCLVLTVKPPLFDLMKEIATEHDKQVEFPEKKEKYHKKIDSAVSRHIRRLQKMEEEQKNKTNEKPKKKMNEEPKSYLLISAEHLEKIIEEEKEERRIAKKYL